jgi:hypothetical protein
MAAPYTAASETPDTLGGKGGTALLQDMEKQHRNMTNKTALQACMHIFSVLFGTFPISTHPDFRRIIHNYFNQAAWFHVHFLDHCAVRK